MTKNQYKIIIYVLLAIIWLQSMWVTRANNYYKLERVVFKHHRHRFLTGEVYFPNKAHRWLLRARKIGTTKHPKKKRKSLNREQNALNRSRNDF